jgi:hypothetical protein
LNTVAEQLVIRCVQGEEMTLIAELARIQCEQFCRAPKLTEHGISRTPDLISRESR